MIAKNMDAKGETLEKKIEFLVEKKALPEMLNDACWIIRKWEMPLPMLMT